MSKGKQLTADEAEARAQLHCPTIKLHKDTYKGTMFPATWELPGLPPFERLPSKVFQGRTTHPSEAYSKRNTANQYTNAVWRSNDSCSIHIVDAFSPAVTELTKLLPKDDSRRQIFLFKHEVTARQQQAADFVRSAKGLNTVRLMARKCEVRQVPLPEAREFFSKTHLQGPAQLNWDAVGLYSNGELVACASFGPHHRQGHQGLWILNRFACLPGVTVAGGLSRICRHFFQLHPEVPLLRSWADKRLSQAAGYLAAGWKVEGDIPPDYFYIDPKAGKIIGKQRRKKGVVNTPAGMTEKEHALLDGLKRVYDLGKIALTLSRNT